MAMVVIFDKFKNREEVDVPATEDRQIKLTKNVDGVEYEIIYEFQFFDKKMRRVYTERERTPKGEKTNV